MGECARRVVSPVGSTVPPLVVDDSCGEVWFVGWLLAGLSSSASILESLSKIARDAASNLQNNSKSATGQELFSGRTGDLHTWLVFRPRTRTRRHSVGKIRTAAAGCHISSSGRDTPNTR